MHSSIPTLIWLPEVGGVVRDQSDEEHEERAQDGWDPGCYEGRVVAPDLVIDQSGHWRSHCHREGEESQEGANGLTRPRWAAQVEGDGADQGDEASIEESHDTTDGEQHLVLVVPGPGGGGEEHGADPQTEEGELQREVRCKSLLDLETSHLLEVNSVPISGEELQVRQLPEEEAANS